MLSKSSISFVKSLEQKKFRQQEQLFIAEGVKIVDELLRLRPDWLEHIYASEAWIQQNTAHFSRFFDRISPVSGKDLERISNLQTPNEVLATVKIPQQAPLPSPEQLRNSLQLAVYNLQDPGNMGTIIRLADWFGMEYLFCQTGSVDVFNPKVVQSTMGSLFRVKVIYTDLADYIQTQQIAAYATAAQGRNLWDINPTELRAEGGLLLIGNESAGLPESMQKLCRYAISIPRIGSAESLNAAVAAGIISSALCRR